MPSQPTGLAAIIARNIDSLIRAGEMTNREVGDRIGTTEHQVWRWRKGRVRPNDENLAALAGVLADGDLTALLIDNAKEAA